MQLSGKNHMKKFFIVLGISTLFSHHAAAAEKIDYTDPEAAAIIRKCENKNTEADNACLKAEIIKIIDRTFEEEEKDYLTSQIENIEESVAKADFNLDDKQIKQFANNKETEKELRLRSLNEIWKKLLDDTIKMMRSTSLDA